LPTALAIQGGGVCGFLMPDPDLSDFNDVLMRQDGGHVINDHRQESYGE
jgi:hypothetical protein